jgi:cytoskeleton protein RodZ
MNMVRIGSAVQLSAAREAAGLTVEDIARRLRLAPRQVAAIERGDWSALPGVAFARGVLRSYGRLLEIDVEPLVEELTGVLRAAELREVASLGEPMPRRNLFGFDEGGRTSRLAWGVLGVAGIVALVLLFGGRSVSSVRSLLESPTSTSTGSPDSPATGNAASRPSADAPASTAATAGTAETAETAETSTVTMPVPLNLPQGPQAQPALAPNRYRE